MQRSLQCICSVYGTDNLERRLPKLCNMESQDYSVSTLLKECEHLPKKRYVIFDQSGNSRRILFHPHLPEPDSFHKTLALGIKAFENAKAARATSLPLAPIDLGWGENVSHNVNNSHEDEDSEELDALLSSDKEEEEEVTSTLTFVDCEETCRCNATSNEVDHFEIKRRSGICNASENGERTSNLEKRRRCNADGGGDIQCLEEESDTPHCGECGPNEDIE